MIEIKGYVVRGKDEQGQPVCAENWLTRRPFKSPTQASAYALNMRGDGCTDLRIFAVAPDGTETPLPTYEEALNALAMARDAAETALRAHGARGMGGAPSELEGCPPGALRALLRLLGGGR